MSCTKLKQYTAILAVERSCSKRYSHSRRWLFPPNIRQSHTPEIKLSTPKDPSDRELSVGRPHYELICCATDYGSTSGSVEDLGSPGVSPLPGYYSAAEHSPVTSSGGGGGVQKGRPRKRKLSEVAGSELPVTMRLTAAGALGELTGG